MPVTAPGVANFCGYLALFRRTLGSAAKSISNVELNSKKPPICGQLMKSKPVLRVCLPMVLEKSSRNCHFFCQDCWGTLVLVPKEASGNVTSGALILLAIRLFQYW